MQTSWKSSKKRDVCAALLRLSCFSANEFLLRALLGESKGD